MEEHRNPDLKARELTDAILRAFYEVYNELGHGFLESVYREAMIIALRDAGHEPCEEVPLSVWSRGHDVGDFKADLIVDKRVLLELKTVEHISRAHEGQTLNYLRATDIEVALILNFSPEPTFRRLVFENDRKKIRVHPRESAVGAR